MYKERVYVHGYWGPRRERLAECAQRAVKTLTDLESFDEIFAVWFEPHRTRNKTLQAKVRLQPDSIAEILLRGQNRREFEHTVIEEFGSTVVLWNGKSAGRAAFFDLHCGAWASLTPNSCGVRFPEEGAAAGRVVSYAIVLKVLSTIVRAWDPEWAVAASHEFRRALGVQDTSPFVGWMTYARANLLGGVHSSLPIRVMPLANGSIVVLSENPPSANDPIQVGNAIRATEELRRFLAKAR